MSTAQTELSVAVPDPNSGSVSLLLTDLYQITMVYAYWKAGRHEQRACFEMFFRKNPFKGNFTIFAGLREIHDQILARSPCFTASDIAYIKSQLPEGIPDAFFEYLGSLDPALLTIDSVREGSVVFPKIPVMSVSGPLALCQLVESTFLNLTGYASLLATNAARMRLCVGPKTALLEFGLRRAQGCDGAMSAARYAFLGGFNSTSNVAAGKRFNIPIKGTHAHSFVMSFHSLEELDDVETKVASPDGSSQTDLMPLAIAFRAALAEHFGGAGATTNDGELASFLAYAAAFAPSFLALVDTYDTLNSGVINFLAVAAALHKAGHKGVGLRLDSGDLAQLSLDVRAMFSEAPAVLAKTGLDSEENLAYFSKFTIVVSDGINTTKLLKFARDGHSIDVYGIGTNLATCQEQPALGMVYKLVEINGEECMKMSACAAKILIPGRKKAYRLYGADGKAAMDVLEGFSQGTSHKEPTAGFAWSGSWPLGSRREALGEEGVKFTPHKVEELLKRVWGPCSDWGASIVDIHEAKAFSEEQRATMPVSTYSKKSTA
eukprot:INCI9937.4.p1 GENE.INCI9937.4~~INCI9937.4.p1  ORF type:complete len:597 (+),score=110.52 INCI9937.4:153-1793(+)